MLVLGQPELDSLLDKPSRKGWDYLCSIIFQRGFGKFTIFAPHSVCKRNAVNKEGNCGALEGSWNAPTF